MAAVVVKTSDLDQIQSYFLKNKGTEWHGMAKNSSNKDKRIQRHRKVLE